MPIKQKKPGLESKSESAPAPQRAKPAKKAAPAPRAKVAVKRATPAAPHRLKIEEVDISALPGAEREEPSLIGSVWDVLMYPTSSKIPFIWRFREDHMEHEYTTGAPAKAQWRQQGGAVLVSKNNGAAFYHVELQGETMSGTGSSSTNSGKWQMQGRRLPPEQANKSIYKKKK